ncbi:MAG: hypothetical protein IKY94_11455 [Lachnospiraceae bacterium]|nr:hypothetical protein [Lachnospiraceae bacterium]
MNRRRALLASASGGGGGIDINNYLTIVALVDGLTASLSTNACEYCVDGDGDWKTLAAATNTEAINTGQTLSFRGNLTPDEFNGIGTFVISKNCNLEGNCMSMLFGDDASSNTSLSGKEYAFSSLFSSCSTIKSVSSGFLPATTLAKYCYDSMFFGCTSLTQAPTLPATTLTSNCYKCMFYRCSNLNYIKAMFTTTPSSSYTYKWVDGVASIGKFIKNGKAIWNVTGVNGIPSGWSIQSAAQ